MAFVSTLQSPRLAWEEATQDHKEHYRRNLLQIVPRSFFFFLTSINGFNTLFIVFKWDFFFSPRRAQIARARLKEAHGNKFSLQLLNASCGQ